MTVCPRCGEQNPERFRICGMCGAALTASPPQRELRKTVSVLFCDLKGSTDLGERLDTESLREALGVYFDEMRAVIERHGGVVEKYIGDAIMAVFGLPAVREDDALRAVRAALEMQRRLQQVNVELLRRWGIRLENRTGVNTGEVVAGDGIGGQRLVTGDTVNTAARLEQAAPPQQILIGPTTYELVRDAVHAEPVAPLELKGKSERVPAYRILGVSTAGEQTARRLAAPLVGRAADLDRIQTSYEAARTGGRPRLVTIVGPAGVGKSRLIHEFLAAPARRGHWLRGRCLSYGEGITFWPVIEMVRAAAAIEDDLPAPESLARLRGLCAGDDRVVDRLAPLLGLGESAFPLEETFWAVRRLVELLAVESPLVAIVDDIHWAEPTFLDLLEHVAAHAEAPVLILCSTRAELFDERPEWSGGGERLDLGPLSAAETGAVVANILDGADLPAAFVERIALASEGNPLFVEQMLSMLIESGDLVRAADGSWSVRSDARTIRVPPGIAALIDARLDRLPSDDRSVIQAASVVGLVFYSGAVAAMSPPSLAAGVDPALERLERRQLVRPDASIFMEEQAFRFDHALIRDGAYRSLLKRERADLHERFAEWLTGVAGHRLGELEEIVGYHLEQGAELLADLGPLDDLGRLLARRAAGHLASAGRRASARGDTPAAASLLERAVRLTDSGSPVHVELQLELAEALADLGEFEASERAASQARDEADNLGDRLLATNALLVLLFLRYTRDPEDRTDEVVTETELAVPLLEMAEDHVGLVRAWRLLGWVHGTACRYGAAERAVANAVEHARLAGDRRAETRNQMSFALSALYGPMPVPRAVTLVGRIAEEVGDDRRAHGVVLCAQAHLDALRGEFASARALYREARETLEGLGGKVMAATVSLDSGRVELLAGDAVAAERELRHDYGTLESVGERYTLSTVAGLLAEALLRQDRHDEALALTEVAEGLAAGDDVESQCLWRRVRALVLAQRGDTHQALALAERAAERVATADAPLMRGLTLLDVGAVQALAGRPRDALASFTTASDLFAEKQATVPLEVARRCIAGVVG
jgi:class 3 adenylate cyclase/tetratricopeptide (TPR) repeat protein